MKSTKRFFLILCLILVIVASIPAFAATKTLNFLETMTSPERDVLIKEMIAEYEATHPGVKINLISPPYEQAEQKATLMLTSEQPLDIIEVRDNDFKQYAINKQLLNLTKYYKGWEETKDLSGITIKAAKSINDTYYVVPQGFYIKALFVRQDILKKNGITTIPTTLMDLVKVCKKITDPAKNQYGYAWRGKNNIMKFSDIFISAYVKDIKQTSYLYTDGKAFFTSPGYIRGIKEYLELYKCAPQDSINWGFNEQINAFVSGMTPFLIQDPDSIPMFDKMLGPDKYVVVPIPLGPYGYSYLDYGFTSLGIPSYSKNKDQAWDFIQWFSSAEKNAHFCEHYGILPIYKTAFTTSKIFRNSHYRAFAMEMNTPNKYIFKSFPLDSPKWSGWCLINETDMQSMLLVPSKLESTLKKWQNYWTTK